MAEREWYEFDDPEREGVSWRVEVTFLSSHWHCIYGRGCPGMYEETDPSIGCCNHGAYFSGEEDRQRVEEAARRLTPAQWQMHGALAKGIGKHKTRIVSGACMFLNRAGFPGGQGCALHVGALDANEPYMDWKPDVCWQVPLRYRQEGDTYVIEEFSRATWGPGGADLHWWCTEAAEVFTAETRVYRSMEPELRRVMGDGAYNVMASYLDERAPVAIPHPTERRVPVTITR